MYKVLTWCYVNGVYVFLDASKAYDKIDRWLQYKQDAREAMRVVFFCTYKMYLYAQNEISYEYIQILF